MARRATIGIPFNYDESWIGGSYYIQNLVASFNLLPPGEQPDVCILTHSEQSFDFILAGSKYSRLTWTPPTRLRDIDGGIFPKIRWASRLIPQFLKRVPSFDVVFPFPIDTSLKQTVCWIPDLQDKRLPHFFDAAELEYRERQHRYYFDNFRHIVFSSEAARSDFHHFYPEAASQTHVVRFAVFPPPRPTLGTDEVLAKYGLPSRFFYCPNQFWIHKNHATVIEAVGLLADRNLRVDMVFSGKEHDHRAPHHAQELRRQAERRGVADRIHFLGFLPRDEQMILFEAAVAIVQPSLFEGWSTVIEDAKALSQYVIASNLPVNLEQISDNAEFFDPANPGQLADMLSKYASADPVRTRVDYRVSQERFARDFMEVVNTVRAESAAPSKEGSVR